MILTKDMTKEEFEAGLKKEAEESRIRRMQEQDQAGITDDFRKMVIEKARLIYGEIYPASCMERLEDCFSIYDKSLILQFNVSTDNSTRALIEKI